VSLPQDEPEGITTAAWHDAQGTRLKVILHRQNAGGIGVSVSAAVG